MPAPRHTTRVPVRWGDQDALGHVNNARYFTYIEQARIEWLEAIADGEAWPGSADGGPILASAEMQFRRPVVYPATLIVETFAARVGRTSFTLRSELRTDADDALAAEAVVVAVWVDRSGRPMPVPEALRAVLSAGLGG